MGDIYRVSYCNEDDVKNTSTSLILKMAPQTPTQRDNLHSQNLFLREITMYDEVRFDL